FPPFVEAPQQSFGGRGAGELADDFGGGVDRAGVVFDVFGVGAEEVVTPLPGEGDVRAEVVGVVVCGGGVELPLGVEGAVVDLAEVPGRHRHARLVPVCAGVLGGGEGVPDEDFEAWQ